MTTSKPNPIQDINAHDFRAAMGSFTTGVCVLGAKREDDELVGMTVNSFTSVSLEPPLVLVCLGADSERCDALLALGKFTISVLAESQIEMSNHFAKLGAGIAPDAGCSTANNGGLIIDGAAAVIDCDVETIHLSGDHQIVIGRVTHLSTDRDKLPLLYFHSQYRHIGSEVG